MISSNNTLTYLIIGGTLLFATLVLIIIMFLIQIQKKNFFYLQEKKLMKAAFQHELLQTQLEIQEQTLQNISEEIHDNIGQVLSLVKLNLNTFPEHLEDPVKLKIQDTELLLSKAIDDLRDLSQSMNTDKISSIGLEAAIEQQLKQIQKTGRFMARLHTSGSRYPLEPQKEMVLFRMVQEALNNAVKHSAATNIDVDILYGPVSLVLQVNDDGKGFEQGSDHSYSSGIGLKNMHNRAVLIGAVFSIYSSIDNGTSINIDLKLELN